MSEVTGLAASLFKPPSRRDSLCWARVTSVSGGLASVAMGQGDAVSCPSLVAVAAGERVVVWIDAQGRPTIIGKIWKG